MILASGSTQRSLAERAVQVMPGGVSSPVRALKAVGDAPLFVDRGSGAHVFDQDGNRLVDYLGSWGAAIVGHAHPSVIEAVERTARDGLSFGATHRLEVALAEEVIARVPAIEQVRFVCSGTEAVMSALRLARAATGRTTIIKFAGGYHGHSDALLTTAGSGVATLGLGDSPGVPRSTTRDTWSLAYNDVGALQQLFAEHGDEIACVILEPICGNMGVVPATPEFLRAARELTRAYGALLIFDEVMTGFRVAYGGAQQRTGIDADIVTLGKVIGGGLPVAAYAARASLMQRIAPLGDVYQAGTLAGNPVGMAAGLATLRLLDADAYARLEQTSAELASGIERALADNAIESCVQRVGSMLTVFFDSRPVVNYDDAARANHRAFAQFFRSMRKAGVLLPPSGYESWFVSLAHGPAEIQHTIDATARALLSLEQETQTNRIAQ